MNKEVHYEGWLIKSPPTKRIWRARWRRRWFTLKQGEIPEQFCLEYYTDRNCRKLKGVIDLDQCEQVDCGLRLENRKQKFQFMFDIKTPKRTYYLAADTEADMRDWVNCICQVCHLHDTKQSSDLQDENRTQSTASSAFSNSTTNTINTVLSSSSGRSQTSNSGALSASRHSFSNDILRRHENNIPSSMDIVVDQQPLGSMASSLAFNNDTESSYVNTEYTNRETVLCDMRFDRQQLVAATSPAASQPQMSLGAAIYLNSPVFQTQVPNQHENARLVVNSNGVVRKIPENLVLKNIPLPEMQHNNVQTSASPALSTASGPYIPISECFSGSPKFVLDGNNPLTPLNNLDPKFYDTPRSHNNIGLNLTNDQSYSPKITNCSLPLATTKNRSHRSDSDSESVFTDDDEWTHPLPLRENVDRSTRPSDSSVENESFVLTYSQRFSKLPEEIGKDHKTVPPSSTADPLEKLAKVLKNKNNLVLDIKANDKIPRDLPQFSDTENTSPAIGPRDATSVVDESYDIPRSHNLPYYNMGQLFEKITSPDTNPIAASTPNLMSSVEPGPGSPSHVRTLPRPHCYTNAAPSKVEGNVFRYDFIEQGDLPPVNRKLKPKVNLEEKPLEDTPTKVSTAATVMATPPQPPPPTTQSNVSHSVGTLVNKLLGTNLQNHGSGARILPAENSPSPLKPPSVDRKLKPNAYKFGNSATMVPAIRRSTGAPLSMVLSDDNESFVMQTRTLPRQPRPNYANGASNVSGVSCANHNASHNSPSTIVQHQRTASAAAAMQMTQTQTTLLQVPPKNEHKLQYFDLDVANPPAINRQSMSVGNLNAPGANRLGLPADPSARAPVKSSVVYNSVDFVKTEAFKRIREERKKESEGINSTK